jgi:acetyl esterase/lipase
MKKIFVTAAFVLAAAISTFAQKTFTVDVWPDGLPNTNGMDIAKPYNDAERNFKPQMFAFLPPADKNTGRAVVCLPGGSYWTLAIDSEGKDWAEFFNSQGVALFVLTYRMPNGYTSVPESDAYEAIRIVRRNAKEWGVDASKVGIMGHSAGGHLCSTVATHSVGDARPDFQILLYPVISMDSTITHADSRKNLLGENPKPEVNNAYSNELQVKPGQSSAILLLSNDDGCVMPENSVRYYQALKRCGVDASMHIFPSGGHGFGASKDFCYHKQMCDELAEWLKHLK